jgi:hypothetical protein
LLIGAVAAAGLAASLVVGIAGGGIVEIAGLQLAIRHPLRPLLIGAACAAIFLTVRIVRGSAARREAATTAVTDLAYWTLCAAIVGMWIAYRVSACGGLDSYAYVSTAHAFANGQVYLDEPLGGQLPFEQGHAAATPPGWLPAAGAPRMLPEFPPGLPLMMALFVRLFGDGGPFWVSPVAAAVAMFAAYGIGKRVGGPDEARLTAVFVGVQPVFVAQAIQPMSDVAATAWLLAAAWCLTRRQPRHVAAGMCAVLAIWTRPPLMLPALAAALIPSGPTARRDRLRYATTLAAGIAGLAAVQWALYGSPTLSGHGSASNLFRLERVPANVTNYLWWFTVVHTPLIYIAIVAAFREARSRRMFFVFLAIFALEAAPYLAYAKVPEWETLRFWLPGIPFLLIVAAVGVVGTCRVAVRGPWLTAAVVLVAWGVAAAAFVFLRQQVTFQLWQSEQRFKLLADVVALHSRSEDVILADVHSGSLRLYAHRPTLRYKAIPAEALPATIRALDDRGRRTMLVLDDWVEEAQFRQQFGSVLDQIRVTSEWRVRGIKVQSLSGR